MIAPFALMAALGTAPALDDPAAARIASDVAALAAFGTRHTLSDQNDRAAEWLADRFRAAGCDAVEFQDYRIGPKTRHNVVATIRGATEPDAIVLVGAHFDSRNDQISDAKGDAPGAVDNASGTAALLEIARSIAAEPPGRTVRLVAFSGEEQGLIGARSYAKAAKTEKMNILLMMNLDMIGHPMDDAGRVLIVDRDQGLRSPDNDAGSVAWAARLEHHVAEGGLEPVPGRMYGSDYMPFEADGVVCVGLFDGADEAPFYHDVSDTTDQVDASYCADAARAALALVREAADPMFTLEVAEGR